MAFCTRCGAKLEEGVDHVCAAAQSTQPISAQPQFTQAESPDNHSPAQVAASAEPPVRPVSPPGSGSQFFNRLWQQIVRGIQDPDGLATDLSLSKDVVNPVIYYIIFGIMFGLFSAAFANKLVASISSIMSGFFGTLYGMDSVSSSLFDTAMRSSVPFGAILLKTTILMALSVAAYGVSFALVSKLFHGKGEVGDFFKAISGTLIPASLTLLIAAIVVSASITLGAVTFLVALIYLCFFPALHAWRATGLSLSRMVYSLPLVHVIPLIVYVILAKAGL